ncbi:hypothetical protein SB778_40675, partial [Paraburkholderia sp. SIMBA_050]
PPDFVSMASASDSREVLLDRRDDPLTGRSTLRFAQAVRDPQGKPVAWFVAVSRPEIDDFLRSSSAGKDYALVSPAGQVLTGREIDPAL